MTLLDLIIDSTDELYINETINKLKENEINKINKSNLKDGEKELKIKEVNDLPLYIKGKGCCIGNMISQIIATFYLDELDKYIYYDLNCKHFARYMDDIYIIHESKEYLYECLLKIKKIVEKYNLKLNNKTRIYSNNDDIEFLVFMFSKKNNTIKMKLTNKTKNKFKYNMK